MLKKPESYLLNACQRRFHLAAFFFSLSLWVTLLTAPSLQAEEAGGDAAEAGNTPVAEANLEPSSDKQLDERRPKDEQVQDDAHHRTNATCLDEDYGPLIDLRREFGRIRRGEVAGLSLPDYRIDGWEETRRATIAAFNRGHYKQATRLAKSLREDAREMLGKSHLGHAIATEIQAIVEDSFDATGSHAIPFREAAETYKKIYGDRHPAYAGCLAKLGRNLAQAGRIDEAIKEVERARGIQEAFYQGPHLGIAETLAAKAYIHATAHNSVDGLSVADECSRMYELTGHTRSVAYAWHLVTIANLYSNSGEHEQALQSILRAEKMFRNSLHQDDPRQLLIQISVANLHRRRGNNELAYELFKDLAPELHRAFGKTTSHYVTVLNNASYAAESIGKDDEAEQLLAHVCQLLKGAGGDSSPLYISTRLNYGMFCARSGRFERAEESFIEVIRLAENLGMTKNQMYGLSVSMLARTRFEGDRKAHDEMSIEREMIEGRQIIEKSSGKWNHFYVTATLNLAEFRLERGQTAVGLELLDEAIQVAEACYGKGHSKVKHLQKKRSEFQLKASTASE